MSTVYPIEVLAIDLEGTLISDIDSRRARPGLFEFLEFCRRGFERLAVFTWVHESSLRDVAALLVERGEAPAWFEGIEYVSWSGDYKDLRFIKGARPETAALLDDDGDYVHPEQLHQWIEIAPFERPYPAEDGELARVQRLLEPRSARDGR